MDKIKEYQIVKGDITEIEGEVNELIKKGWQPIGGIFIDEFYNYYQAMIWL